MKYWRLYRQEPSILLAASPLHLDFRLTGPAWIASLLSICALRCMPGQVPAIGGFGDLSHLSARVRAEKVHVLSRDEGLLPDALRKSVCHPPFADATPCWHNRRCLNPTTAWHPHPHLSHRVRVRSKNRHEPAWADSQAALWGDGNRRSPASVSAPFRGHRARGRLESHEDHEVRMCRKLCEDGRNSDTIGALDLLVQRGRQVHRNLFYRVLKACIAHKDLALGARVHALTIEGGYEGDAFLATHLIGLYASHGRMEEAMRVFTKVPTPSSYNWATIIFAYARHGEGSKAIGLYRKMREATASEPDDRIYLAVLKACATARDLVAGRDIHSHILASPRKADVFVQTALVDMYAKCRSLGDARRVFDRLPERDVATWNALLAGYAQEGMGERALGLYNSMQGEGIVSPSSVTFVYLLQACASVGVGALHQGKQLHSETEERGLQDDVVVGGSLVNMYAKCGSLGDARSVFDRLPERNVVTWTVMIAAYAGQRMGKEALGLYSRMQLDDVAPPNPVTFVCLLQACASVGEGALDQGKKIHSQIVERGLQDNVVVGGSLVNMYAKCSSLEDARRVFDRLPDRNVVSWTAMIAGYAKQDMAEEALTLYSIMQQECISSPDSVAFTCLLQACAIVAALPLGKQLHEQILERGLQADLVVGAALVNMYAKCGSMFDAHQVFDSLSERSIEAWGALSGGYSRQGDSEAVFDLLDRMRLEGVQPDGITFVSLLTACSHAGLVDKGREYFQQMSTGFGISPSVEHYACMMDLLGRAGQLDEALQMAKTLPFPPNGVVWLTVLAACQKWKNVKIGEQAFEGAVSVDGKDPSSYVLMSNIYAGAQMWEDAKEMQARRKQLASWKDPGQSWWMDMAGVVHSFRVGGH